MKKLILSLLAVMVLGIACCGGNIPAEAVIIEMGPKHKDEANCGVVVVHYRLAEYPKHTSNKEIYKSDINPILAAGDTIIVRVHKSTMEDLLNLYLGEEI